MTRVGMTAQSALSLAAAVALPFFGAAGASIDIASSVTERAADYARISTNTSMAVFYLGNVVAPTPREECRIGDRTVAWSVSPETQGGHSSLDTESIIVRFSNPSDFGKSYVVSATATWRVYDESNGNVVDVIRKTDSFQLDAILYSFSVECSDGTHSLSNLSALVDNHPADATITPVGCSRRDLLSLSLNSVPMEQSPVNKAGTSMPFACTANPCVLHTPKTFWYGLNDPDDCFFKKYYYIMTLFSDNEPVAQRYETVGWPDENPSFNYYVNLDTNLSRTVTRKSDGRVVITIYNCRYDKLYRIRESSCQYTSEIYTEECFHREQFLGNVGLEYGGFGDLFDVDRATREAGFQKLGNGVYQKTSSIPLSENQVDIYVYAVSENLRNSLQNEIEQSHIIVNQNLGYIERCAKQVASYNAAYRYHCTYGNQASGCRYLGDENDLRPREGRE